MAMYKHRRPLLPILKLALLISSGLLTVDAATYDHYTTQYGSASDSAGRYSVLTGYGNIVASALGPFDQYVTHRFTSAKATAGYHDSLIFLGQPTGTAGVLDILYSAGSYNGIYDFGSSGTTFAATGFSLPSEHTRFFSLLVPATVAFQYGVPLSLDGVVTEYASGGNGDGELQIKSLFVETSDPFYWSASSGTQYNFQNGVFVPTPEPGSAFLGGLSLTLLAAINVLRTRHRS